MNSTKKTLKKKEKKTTVLRESTVLRVFITQLVWNQNLWPLRLALESSESHITDM